MQTFPPSTQAFEQHSRAARGDRARRDEPDTRSPSRFLFWILRTQADLVALNAVLGLLWFMPSALNPWLIGKAIDHGVLAHSVMGALPWALAMMVAITVGVLAGVGMHSTAVVGWLVAMYKTTKLLLRKVAQLGHVAPRRTPAGEMLSVAGGDADTFGAVTEVFGRGIAALGAFGFVAALVLNESLKLGLVTLVAAPLLVGAASPLLRPLQRAQAIERSRTSELTGMATDIVAGLRILRGIGGEQTFGDNYATQSQSVRRAGVSAGTWQAAVDALGVLLSGLLLVMLTWLGAHEMLAGRLSIGQLVSFFGYAIFMVWPIQTFFEFAQKWVQGLVSAKKTIAVLGQQAPWHEPAEPLPLPQNAVITDDASGLVARPGRMTVVVSAVPDDSAALADRIGRYLPAETEPVSLTVDDDLKGKARKAARAELDAQRAALAEADEQRAGASWGVRFDEVDLARVPLDELRSRVLVSDTAGQVFAGTLQELLDPHGTHSREQAETALRVASAEDVYDALPGGWQGVLDERGRGLSGGQRQRLVLARAVLADPEVLVLVEPTSAVDAHTEARIAERLAEHRRGRTTIVTTVSPLLLHHADDVVLLVDGRAAAHGSHAELLASSADYRAVVARGMDDEDAPEGGTA
ncbi:ABC transporter ATP-binding protein [Luteococcus peritonei]|uniref:ABC transporter ATP-binding protein n=1 Tax=Luteococcus peritonei TaxID=88874 RepID=A0ABW4RV81_9ACTN